MERTRLTHTHTLASQFSHVITHPVSGAEFSMSEQESNEANDSANSVGACDRDDADGNDIVYLLRVTK